MPYIVPVNCTELNAFLDIEAWGMELRTTVHCDSVLDSIYCQNW